MTNEDIEWTDSWCNQLDNEKFSRVLLIGDSIARAYYPAVQQNLNNKYLVDRFSTSRFVSTDFYQQEIKLYSSSINYDVIHFNNGIHGVEYSLDEYYVGMNNTVKMLKKRCNKLIMATSTPKWNSKAKLINDFDLNQQIIARNQIIKDIAEKYQIPVNDLYGLSTKVNFLIHRSDDGVHYLSSGSDIQGEKVGNFIQDLM